MRSFTIRTAPSAGNLRIKQEDDHGPSNVIDACYRKLDGYRLVIRSDPSGAARMRAVWTEVGSAAAAKAKAANTGTVSGFSNLKKIGPERAVVAVRSHQGTYIVTTADGRSIKFGETFFRFKINSSKNRPLGREPVIVPTGMTGDRATVIFAPPTEISDLIKVDARIN